VGNRDDFKFFTIVMSLSLKQQFRPVARNFPGGRMLGVEGGGVGLINTQCDMVLQMWVKIGIVIFQPKSLF
jgi:hypothetical protein